MNKWFLKIDVDEMKCYPIKIEEVSEEGLESLSPLYKEIKCDIVERVSLGDNLELWIDEEGLFTKKNAFLAQYNYKGETHGWESNEDVPLIHISDWLLIEDPTDFV
mgnify:CR=1 FL=1